MTPLLLVLALVGASPRPSDAALWEAAFALNDPAEAPRAEALLTKAGPAGLDVLVKLARAGGEAAAINAAAPDLRCHLGLAGDPVQSRMLATRNPEPARIAARMLSTRMKEDPRLHERLLTSRSSFERRLALAHLAPDLQALLGVLPRLDKEKDPQVLTLAARALQCAIYGPGLRADADREALRAAQAKFNKKLEGLLPQNECASAEGITGALREGLRQRLWQLTGWSASGRSFALSVDTGRGVSMQLTPPCALALYDVLVQREVYLPGLVVPLSTSPDVKKELRVEAARRAVRDLDRYPELDRNRLAAELVNAGHPVSRAIVLREDAFPGEAELEAAARLHQPGATAAIESYVFCRGMSGSSTLALLGFVGTPQAAETAVQFASRCPQARAPATAALLRLKDPRALEWLGPSLEQSILDWRLRDAAGEAYTPALGEKLRALKDSGGPERSRQATALLKHLKEAGLPVP